jgi:LysR family glycine cleavage system transcriptional activator
MRRVPSFSALRAFEAAARLGSFSLACQELHLTPSAVSHQVRSLEGYFGHPLFIRHNRHNELTADGQRLLTSLSPAFDAIEVACSELSPSPRKKSLAIHCSPSFASKWLGPRLPDFMRQHPSIAIRLSSGAEPIELVGSEAIDAAVTYGGVLEWPGLITEPLGPEEVSAFCTLAMAAEFGSADLSRLADLALIESLVSPVRWSDWFVANGLKRPPVRGAPSFDRGALAISAARQGLGVALESRRFAHEELAAGELVPLGGDRFHRVTADLHWLSYRSGKKSANIIAPFRGWLFDQIASES